MSTGADEPEDRPSVEAQDVPPPSPPPATDEQLIDTAVDGRFRIERIISPSTASTLFAAVDGRDGTDVLLRIHTPGSTVELGDELLDQARLVAEIDQRNVARVLGFGRSRIGGAERVWVASVKPGAGTLQDMIDRGRLLSPSQALMMAVDVCRALDHAHRRGVLHHDLRPSAIGFGDDQRVIVTDLGVAAVVAERAWADPATVSLERARYSAPEQARGEAFDEKADVFALALVISEAIGGTVPFLSDSAVTTLSSRLDKLFPVSADLGALAAVLERAGRNDPAERSSAKEMGRGLVQAASSMPRPTPLNLVSDVSGSMLRPEVAPTPVQESADPTGEIAVPGEFTDLRRGNTGPIPTSGLTIRDGDASPAVAGEDGDQPLVARWILIAVGVLALLVGGFFAYRVLTDDAHEVPVLAGLDEGTATNAVTQFDWVVEVVEEASGEYPLGQVIRTEPPAGGELDSGGTITFVISSGPPPVPLVDVTGADAATAVARITDIGLVANQIQEYSEDVAVGIVTRWVVPAQPNLMAGDDVVGGTTVDVYVSQGPQPRTVPLLVGLSLTDAQAQIDGLQLVLNKADDVYSNDIPAGSVATQSPNPGDLLDRGLGVTVALSKGPDVVAVPVTQRLTFDQVKQAVVDSGLVVGNVTGNTRGVLISLFANGQPVAAGQLLPRGTAVDLVYFG